MEHTGPFAAQKLINMARTAHEERMNSVEIICEQPIYNDGIIAVTKTNLNTIIMCYQSFKTNNSLLLSLVIEASPMVIK